PAAASSAGHGPLSRDGSAGFRRAIRMRLSVSGVPPSLTASASQMKPSTPTTMARTASSTARSRSATHRAVPPITHRTEARITILPRPPLDGHLFLPESGAAGEGVAVVARQAGRRQLVQLLDVAAA